MAVVDVQQDLDNNQLTMISDFAAPVERVWQVWSDPRQLEQWWGPPGYPAAVTEHDLTAGGKVRYFMTSPEGVKHHGWWEVLAAEAPHSLELRDGFGDKDGNPTEAMPVSVTQVELTEHEGGTRMTSTTTYASADQFKQVLEMGMVEGSTQAANQIDALLAA
ncbi:SRPBCC family protein [Demetria terragena]|uniref:SRPBCC family protein n=1 Tax=Demetria terragena TaxID=63959 RepID=UPI0003815B15|nr:SRPBCC domain-containing protein [Demetria terragena]